MKDVILELTLNASGELEDESAEVEELYWHLLDFLKPVDKLVNRELLVWEIEKQNTRLYRTETKTIFL